MAAASQENELMYLSLESWSPRFDSNFYTIKMDQKEFLQSAPAEDSDSVDAPPPGKHQHPAYYYRIDVFRERHQHSVVRRFSQFRWLYDQIAGYSPPQTQEEGMPPLDPIVFPPKTCPWHTQDEEFAQNRLEGLREFLTDVLRRPGIASHPAVRQFLKLNEVVEGAQK